MSSKKIKLRGQATRRHEEFPLGEIPDEVINAIGRQFVHRISIGQKDVSGDDFAEIFSRSIKAKNLSRPLGIADVVKENAAWSVKTIKVTKPYAKRIIRLISGRNSPDYSMNISDPRADPEATGKAVLEIWNARVNEALGQYNDLRILVLIRNFETREFSIFEEEANRYIISDYIWKFNTNNNLEGFDKNTNKHCFTWQPSGGQFTVKNHVPSHARHFTINHNVPTIDDEHVLNFIKFKTSWISIVN